MIRRGTAALACALLGALPLTAACIPDDEAAPTTSGPRPASASAEIVAKLPHDTALFTEGLELDGDVRYESSGLYGESAVYAIDRRTGAVLRTFRFPPQYFAEGLTKVGENLIVLTWQEQTAFVLDAATFTERARITYEGEGWGICALGDEVVTSDGTDLLRFRDPATFAIRRTVAVRDDGLAVRDLNELECVDGAVWANRWKSYTIYRIDPSTGIVTAALGAGALQPIATQGDPEAVLNGIAHDPATGRFLLTGKRWAVLYDVRITVAGTPR